METGESFAVEGEAVSHHVGDVSLSLEEAPKRSFAAWHRPRKHYVRKHQWKPLVDRLISELANPPKALRYLTLPGDDLLDVHYLHDAVCVPFSVDLQYLGFNLGANTSVNANTSEHQAIHLDRVAKDSDVLPADIRAAGLERSVSWTKVRQGGPFHAINLDLCDGVGSLQGHGASYFDLLAWLLPLQSQTTMSSLLFLTTRIDRGSQDVGMFEILKDLVLGTATRCQGFDAALRAQGADNGQGDATLTDLLTDEQFVLFGVCIWILKTAEAHNIECCIESVLTYRVNPAATSDDLASLAFRLNPRIRRPLPDGTGVTNIAASTARDDCTVVEPICPACYQRVRVDCVLHNDSSIASSLEDEMTTLLQRLGYDETEYREFVAGRPDCQPV